MPKKLGHGGRDPIDPIDSIDPTILKTPCDVYFLIDTNLTLPGYRMLAAAISSLFFSYTTYGLVNRVNWVNLLSSIIFSYFIYIIYCT